MNVNEMQVGGTHYKTEYEHWDYVLDTNQDYLIGNATKYVARHAKKNGLQDLMKAQHYINKALSLCPDGLPALCPAHLSMYKRMTVTFCQANDLGALEENILTILVTGTQREDLMIATAQLRQLVSVKYPIEGVRHQQAEEDPCSACERGGVCRTPECGRLKLPADHPFRCNKSEGDATPGYVNQG